MPLRPRFSFVRVAAWSQVGTFGFTAWFALHSLRLSCASSQDVARAILVSHSPNCGLLAAAVAVERRWDCWAYPILSWVAELAAVDLANH